MREESGEYIKDALRWLKEHESEKHVLELPDNQWAAGGLKEKDTLVLAQIGTEWPDEVARRVYPYLEIGLTNYKEELTTPSYQRALLDNRWSIRFAHIHADGHAILELCNTHGPSFGTAKEAWGVVTGFTIYDDRSEVCNQGHLNMWQHISERSPVYMHKGALVVEYVISRLVMEEV